MAEPSTLLHSMQRNGLRLAAFAVVATLLVVAAANLTAPRIAAQQQQELLALLNQLLPASLHDNDLVASCTLLDEPTLGGQQRAYRATLDGQPTGLAVAVTAPNGYSGAIRLLVAFAHDGSIVGVRTVAHQETPGLGDKIELRKDDWILGFNGLRVNGSDDQRWAVRRDGGQFDAFTGATITPRAVIQAVKQASLRYQQQADAWYAAAANCPTTGGLQ